MAVTEKIQLLGGAYYTGKNIPTVLTLTSIPTSSELDYVAAEDFDDTMINSILPRAVEEKINFNSLLEIDYQWLLRCLRIINYGPYFTTNYIYCDKCGGHQGDYTVNLNTIECKQLPEGSTGEFVIKKDEFIDFDKDVHVKLLTIKEALDCMKDGQFNDPATGKPNRRLARLSYMITSIGNEKFLNPIETRLHLLNDFSAADYQILKAMEKNLTDFGLRAGGHCTCPHCGGSASFLAFVDDRYFRPTLDDLRRWKADKAKRQIEDAARSKTANVRNNR